MNKFNGRISGESNEEFIKRVHPIREEKLRKAKASGNAMAIKYWEEKFNEVNSLKRKRNYNNYLKSMEMELDGGRRRKTHRKRRSHKKRTLRRRH